MQEPKIDIEQLIQKLRDMDRQLYYYVLAKTVNDAADTLEHQQREIESLRSQLAVSEDQYKVIAEEKAEIEMLLEEAEREWDELREEYNLAVSAGVDTATRLVDTKMTLDTLRVANTALLNGLRWYGDESIYDTNEGAEYPEVLVDEGEQARDLLAQYDTSKSGTLQSVSLACPNCSENNVFNICDGEFPDVEWFKCSFCGGIPTKNEWLAQYDTSQ
ncbi:hypothetical protein K0T92_14380 [Paenibacillus oenotherae]|uniref:Uncharacterized protein n=1 Tax=Paenibacillus oenotherae TaxID=1435645 RepID=A0ABS7D7Y8_9BACL|nr:hypothetical protein [Paenibacillus oenotherae]MBW7475929.1 hypothetical protein [Paenibacillus oenotherae]